MTREQRRMVIDRARRYAQALIENAEIIFAFDELSDDEFNVMSDELVAIAKRIGKTRSFASRDPQS